MAYSTLLFDKTDGVVTITLNRPDKSNAFDDTMSKELIDALKTIERDADARAVVITGAGKNFCAGQDLSAMLERYQVPGGVSYAAHLRGSYNLIVSRLRALEKPVIAAVNGAAAGAGLGLALACDFRYASENARFRTAFIGIALAPDSAISFLLPRIIGLGRALGMALTNELVDAPTALQYGLVNRVFKPEELLPQTHEFAAQLAQAPTKAIGLTKRAFNHSFDVDLETALENEALLQEIAGRSADHLEGVQAFIEKRSPQFKGK
jgi:2-(1,2-epoxy-1,2-dihydrophenyl)acetyl-CoA isomerase